MFAAHCLRQQRSSARLRWPAAIPTAFHFLPRRCVRSLRTCTRRCSRRICRRTRRSWSASSRRKSELEIWKQDASGKFAHLKTYPICRWSGELGPKVKQGDRQAPEGFYTITPAQMNPNSNYYLSFNLGFPNAYDRANNRDGAFLMVHGDCSSAGCYAMTDEQIGEIFALGRDLFFGGQKAFQVQAYPFRMTALNMARHRNNPAMPFWRMIKQGYDIFEVTREEPKVDVCDRHYVFNAVSPSGGPLTLNPRAACPAYRLPEEIASAVKAKETEDERKIAELQPARHRHRTGANGDRWRHARGVPGAVEAESLVGFILAPSEGDWRPARRYGQQRQPAARTGKHRACCRARPAGRCRKHGKPVAEAHSSVSHAFSSQPAQAAPHRSHKWLPHPRPNRAWRITHRRRPRWRRSRLGNQIASRSRSPKAPRRLRLLQRRRRPAASTVVGPQALIKTRTEHFPINSTYVSSSPGLSGDHRSQRRNCRVPKRDGRRQAPAMTN